MYIYVTKKGKNFWVDEKRPQKGKNFIDKEIPDLRTFLRKNPEIKKNDLFKTISYWTYIDYHNVDETGTQYGFIKRKLSEFWKNGDYFRIVRNSATSIASEIKKKLQYIEDQSPRYVRKIRVHSRPRVWVRVN